MSGKGTLDLVERLTNECIDVCQAVLRGRKYLGPLLDPSFRTQKLQRAVNEQKTAVGEMEMAVDRIMTAVEKMSEIDFSDGGAAALRVAECCDEIMEACCFQDITGQRLSQVNETLGVVEDTLSFLSDGPAETVQPDDKTLLNGPALPGGGMGQDAVDRLLADDMGKQEAHR
ncbi:MAG: hypothetical protein U0942_06715 [Parvibaculum sp.]|uniref:hypothetical protein n=1 Tax=Parvibaculum sp. TaxID=2024848 RepID=UPI000CA8796B|nr:hypothetical protein [Parvibaculum sp.]MDZ4381017.1 hypothetical protein [Parvibaculum sp.]PKP78954.1 MAG: hypothetical protein CVT81_01265 [Alphaproteobacteria bacterium HGW-Alphaproteobacteria-3]